MSHTAPTPIALLRLLLLLAGLSPLTGKADLRSDMYRWQAEFKPSAAERQAGAVVLQKRGSLVVTDAEHSRYRVSYIIAVLDEQAANDYSRFQSGFNSFYEENRLIAAHLLNPDGEFRDAAADAIQVKTPDQAYRYDDTRLLSFALPAVRPGSIVAYEIETLQKRAIMPGQWHNRASFAKYQQLTNGFRLDPVRDARFTLDVPAGSTANYRALNMNTRPQVSRADGHTRYTWTVKNFPGLAFEENMPTLSTQVPQLMLTSLTDWRQVDDWASALFLPRAQPDAKLKEITAGLIKPGMSPLEKTRAIFYHVQKNIRYIGADLDRGGYTPHHAGEVLRNAYGDCKDQAVILIAMLRAAGITAYPALIGSYHEPQPDDDVPTLFFSHMIVRVPDVAGGLWLDSSGDAGSFPSIGWQLEARRSFVIDGHGGQLLTLPSSKAADNLADARVRYSFEGDDIIAHIEVALHGAFSHTFKLMHKHDPQHEESLKRIAAGFHDGAPLRSLDIRPALNDDAPYRFTAEARIKGAYASSKRENLVYGGNLAPLVSVFTNLPQLQNQATRHSDYYLGFPYTLRLRRTITPPDDAYRPIIPDAARSVSDRWLDYRLRVEDTGKQIESDARLVAKVPMVAQADYTDFRRAVTQTLSSSSWTAIYKRDENYLKQRKLETRVADSNSDLKTLLELANHHLMMADYSHAQTLAKQAIQRQPDNGEAHYVLGISLGFMDQFDASEAELKKARELGYTR